MGSDRMSRGGFIPGPPTQIRGYYMGKCQNGHSLFVYENDPPTHVITKADFESGTQWEKLSCPAPPKPHVTVDLDSTLCDTRHRQGIVEKYKARGEDVNWDEYARACAEDAPTGLVTLLQTIQASQPWHVVSGRSEGAREGTLRWLEANGLEPMTVNLEDGDTHSHTSLGHTEWKARRVLQIAEKYPVNLHIDDWPDVALRVEELSEGRIRGITVTPPGMVAAYPDNPSGAQVL